MGRDERAAAIEELQKVRGGTVVLAYVTSTRPGLEVAMAMDVIDLVYEHLVAIKQPKKQTKIDLFIHSNGGDGVVPWRLVTLLREFCSEFTVLVPNRAFSAATLTALGADKVLMHPMGMLGPTDPTVTNEFNPPNDRAPGQLLGISVEDVASYIALVKEEVGIQHEDELVQAFLALANKVHPLALGNVKRSTMQSRMMGEKLLRSRVSKPLEAHAVSEIINKLTSELYYHGHPINRSEARTDLGLNFVEDPSSDVEKAMWELFLHYRQDLELDREFNYVLEGIRAGGILTPPVVTSPTLAVRTDAIPVIPGAVVESAARCDVYEIESEVTLNRNSLGETKASFGITKRAWRKTA